MPADFRTFITSCMHRPTSVLHGYRHPIEILPSATTRLPSLEACSTRGWLPSGRWVAGPSSTSLILTKIEIFVARTVLKGFVFACA